MPELETENSEFESLFAVNDAGGGGGDGGDPPTGMSEWWKTPASLIKKPVAVDPAIYGIDRSDTVIDDVAADVKSKHHAPDA